MISSVCVFADSITCQNMLRCELSSLMLKLCEVNARRVIDLTGMDGHTSLIAVMDFMTSDDP